MLRYPALIHKDPDGMWVEFPDVPGCHTQGDTMEELVSNCEEALSLHLGVLFDEGDPIPEPSNITGENIIYINVLPHSAIPILLKKFREEQGLSQKELAEKILTSYQSYQKLEQSNSIIKTLERVASAMGKKLRVDFI